MLPIKKSNDCLLCLDFVDTTFNLSSKINENLTIEDAIKEQFCNHQFLINDKTRSSIVCSTCYSALKTFYNFLDRINLKHSFSAIKIKTEDEQKSLNFEEVLCSVNEIELKNEIEFEDDIEDTQLEDNFTDLQDETTQNSQIFYSDIENTKKYAKPSKSSEDQLQKCNRNSTRDAEIRQFVEIKCHECEIPIESFMRLGQHFREVHPAISQYLICCGKKIKRKNMLLNHKAMEFQCEICKKIYKSEKALRTHMKSIHEGVRKKEEQVWVCNECGKVLKSQGSFNNHMFTHQSDPDRLFECYICHRNPYRNFHQLRQHFTTKHNRERPKRLACPICSIFVSASHLAAHIRCRHSSTPIERQQCTICEHWVIKDRMKFHMTKHSDLGVTCEICGKFLRSRHSLPTHIRLVHRDIERNFRCHLCEKAFHKEKKLKEHVAAAHTREFLFKCRVEGCKREFRAEGNWKMHEKRAHPQEYETIFKPYWMRGPEQENNILNNN